MRSMFVFSLPMLAAVLVAGCVTMHLPRRPWPDDGALRDYCRDLKRSRAVYGLVGAVSVPIAVADSQQLFGTNLHVNGVITLLTTLTTVVASAMISERTVELVDEGCTKLTPPPSPEDNFESHRGPNEDEDDSESHQEPNEDKGSVTVPDGW